MSGFASLNLKAASGNDDMHLLRLSENRKIISCQWGASEIELHIDVRPLCADCVEKLDG